MAVTRGTGLTCSLVLRPYTTGEGVRVDTDPRIGIVVEVGRVCALLVNTGSAYRFSRLNVVDAPHTTREFYRPEWDWVCRLC